MLHPAPVELGFLAMSVVGVIISIVAVVQTTQQFLAFRRRRHVPRPLDPIRIRFSLVRVRQEVFRLVVQLSLAAVAVLSSYVPNVPPRHDHYMVHRAMIVVLLMVVELLLVVASVMDQYDKFELRSRMDRKDTELRERAQRNEG